MSRYQPLRRVFRPLEPTPRPSSFNQAEFYTMFSKAASPRSHVYASSFHGVTPRASNYEDEMAKMRRVKSMSGEIVNSRTMSSYPTPNPVFSGSGSYPRKNDSRSGGGTVAASGDAGANNKEVHMFVWSSSSPAVSDGNIKHEKNGTSDYSEFEGGIDHLISGPKGKNDFIPNMSSLRKMTGNEVLEIQAVFQPSAAVYSRSQKKRKTDMEGVMKDQQMPPLTVMTRLIVAMVSRKLIRNPNTYASILGLIWSLVAYKLHITMPTIISNSIEILSSTGLGMAMFSLGLFMALPPNIIVCGKSVATFAMGVRFLIGPAAMAACAYAVGLRGLLHVSVVQVNQLNIPFIPLDVTQVALPQGIVPFVFAKEYNVHPEILSTAVIFGMLVALPVTIVYYILLQLYVSTNGAKKMY